MAASPELLASLVHHEGRKLFPYTDTAGKITIGVGRNLTDVGISLSEAELLLTHDIERAEKQLDQELPWWRGLDPVRRDVLVELTFNMGIGSLLGFHHTLSAIANRNWSAAHDGLLASKWARDVGPNRSQTLAGIMLRGAR